MKILVADKISPSGIDFLRKQAGFEVLEAFECSPQEKPARVAELSRAAAAIIVRSDTTITKEIIANAPELKAIGRAGVGVDNIDIDAATDRGVIVMNTPGGNTVATAELTFTHMLCATRPVPQAAMSMREGRWDRKSLSGSELRDKVLGVCGLGRIGAEVAQRAKAFGMRVLAYDPYLTEARAENLGVSKVSLEEVFKQCHYITVHMPLNDQTRYMIDEKAIAKMKDGVRLINCARGGIIKESALVEALKSGKVAAAGLDVYETEPLPEDSELRQIPSLTLTPHLGASTVEAQESVGLEIAEAIYEALTGGAIRNAINMPSLDAKTLKSVGPYLELCSHLGTFVQQLATDEVEQVNITLFGKACDVDGGSLARGVLRGFLKNISGGSSANFVNAFVVIERLGIGVETIKSNKESDYTELIRVEAKCRNGESVYADGTLLGKGNRGRIVAVNGREVELEPSPFMLVLANEDRTGIVGQLGTIIGNDGVNIAAMSLSRNEVGGVALNIASLDSELSEKALREIEAIPEVRRARLVRT